MEIHLSWFLVQWGNVLFEIWVVETYGQTFWICGKNFKNFDFIDCKVVGLEFVRLQDLNLEENVKRKCCFLKTTLT